MMDYIRSLLSFIFAISVMCMLLDCEIKYKKHRYLLGLYVAVVLVFDMLVLLNFGYAYFMKLYPLLVHLPTFIAFLFVSKFKPIKVFFILLTLVAISTSFSIVGLLISLFFDSSREIVNIVCYILYLPTGVIVYKYLRPSFLYMMHNTDKGWLGFCVIPLTYYMLVYSIAKYDLDNLVSDWIVRDAVLLSILTTSAYYLILRFFKQTREHLILKNEQDLLKTQVTAAQVHLKSLQDSQQKTIIYRHDMHHHLNLINSYLTDNNKEAAQRYIADVENCIEDVVVEKYCNNYTVNLIVSSYIDKAKNEGITVETQINLPEKTAISDMDLCVVFANALENAIKACKNIPHPKDRTLKILCKTKNNWPFIQITNSYEGKVKFVNDMPVSTEENHGLGTKSIVAVAQKYGGVYSFTAQDGLFQTSIIL